jgi:hypothetical protein
MASIDYMHGPTTILRIPVAASQTLVAGTAVKLVSGLATVAGAGEVVHGITIEGVTTGAGDAGKRFVSCHIAPGAFFRVAPSTGSFVAADLGKRCDVAAGAKTALRTAAANPCFVIHEIESAQAAIVRFEPGAVDAS